MEDPLLQSLQALLLLSDEELREKMKEEQRDDDVLLRVATLRKIEAEEADSS